MRQFAAMSLLALTLQSTATLAHEPGEFIIRAGATNVEPRESSDALLLNGTPLNLGGSTAALGLDSSTQVGLTFSYMLTRSFGVELLAATPFRHTAAGTGALAGLDIADARQLPPTLSLTYHLALDGPLLPYVGAGVNYTTFFKEEVTGTAAATLATLGLTGGNVSLDSSWGLSLQTGFDYHLTDKVLLNASVRWIDIDTDATIDFANGSRLQAAVEVDPFVYTLALGYVF